jgi:hypothetical protein
VDLDWLQSGSGSSFLAQPVANLIVKTVRFYTAHFYVWTNGQKRNISHFLAIGWTEGHFTNEFVSYVCETEDGIRIHKVIESGSNADPDLTQNLNQIKCCRYFQSNYNQVALKGTVSRDFRPSVFSFNCTPGSPDSWAKTVLHIDLNSRRYSIFF